MTIEPIETMAQAYPLRVSTAIQFTSHEAPVVIRKRLFESAGRRRDLGDHEADEDGRPLNDSSEKNSPRPSAKDPSPGGLIPPPRTLADWMLHKRDAGS